MNHLHKKILELAVYFDQFCTKHDIQYYLMGGSALGAIRHKGFIPWDDDFDVFMDYQNYQKFLEIASSELNEKLFYLQKEDTEEWPMYFTKLRMNGTTYVEKDVINRKMHHGIYIDVMCLNKAYDSIFKRKFQYYCAKLLSAKALGEKGYESDSFFKKSVILFSSFFVRGVIKRLLLNYVRSGNAKELSMVGHFFGRAEFLKTSFPVNWLGKQRYVSFENLKLPVAQKVEQYLEVRYGQCYMELPSEEVKALYPSHAYLVDVDKDYTEYLK